MTDTPPPKAQSNKRNQRNRTLNNFFETVYQADVKAIELIDLLNNQTRNQFEFAILIHKILVGVSTLVLIVSLVIVFFASSNQFLQTFSLIGTPISLITLLIAFLRNPIIQQHQVFEKILKLNVIFLTFIHQVQNAGLLLERTLIEDTQTELAKLYALIKDFENIEDETLEKLRDI